MSIDVVLAIRPDKQDLQRAEKDIEKSLNRVEKRFNKNFFRNFGGGFKTALKGAGGAVAIGAAAVTAGVAFGNKVQESALQGGEPEQQRSLEVDTLARKAGDFGGIQDIERILAALAQEGFSQQEGLQAVSSFINDLNASQIGEGNLSSFVDTASEEGLSSAFQDFINSIRDIDSIAERDQQSGKILDTNSNAVARLITNQGRFNIDSIAPSVGSSVQNTANDAAELNIDRALLQRDTSANIRELLNTPQIDEAGNELRFTDLQREVAVTESNKLENSVERAVVALDELILKLELQQQGTEVLTTAIDKGTEGISKSIEALSRRDFWPSLLKNVFGNSQEEKTTSENNSG